MCLVADRGGQSGSEGGQAARAERPPVLGYASGDHRIVNFATLFTRPPVLSTCVRRPLYCKCRHPLNSPQLPM
eukprot:1188897-Prorocentrum_minimum.AAC.3